MYITFAMRQADTEMVQDNGLRGYVGKAGSQLHYRRFGAGGKRPLIMLHPNPGSSAMLVPLARRLAREREVIAMDLPGLGLSDGLDKAAPEISDFAQAVMRGIDQLGVETFDLYGIHTGGNVVIELAIGHPARIGGIILDGISFYDPNERQDLLANYAKPLPPNLEGSHLLWAWHFVRDQWCFWPWYRRADGNRRAVDLPTPDYLHQIVVDVLGSLATFPKAYEASFRYLKEDRLPLLKTRTLIAASSSDIFFERLRQVADCLPSAHVEAIDSAGETDLYAPVRVFSRFLDA